MRDRLATLVVLLGLLTLPAIAGAQAAVAPRRVGILCTANCPNIPIEVSRGGVDLVGGLLRADSVIR
jgi:hypothetical protein